MIDSNFSEACTACYFFAVGIASSLITWVANDRPKTFLNHALPNALLNGIFGTTLVLILMEFIDGIHIELLLAISASSGSLGRHALISMVRAYLNGKSK